MELSKVVAFLRRFAPLELAETWDNVGLLLEPTACRVKRVFLTNDLTEVVADEAVSEKVDLVVSYHPPLFKPFNRINNDSWKSRIIAKCLENRVAVYSPHTSWDHVRGGVNDWLGTAFKGVVAFDVDYIAPLSDDRCLADCEAGIGRVITFADPLSIDKVISAVGRHVGISCVRLARPFDHPKLVKRIAICAGSGSAVFKMALTTANSNFDAVLTGEMSHHELLDFVHLGSYVILCEHSNSERGFLREFKSIIEAQLPVVAILSKKDRDPVEVITL